MPLLSRILPAKNETRYAFDDYLSWLGFDSLWSNQLVQTWTTDKNAEPASGDYPSYAQMFKGNGPVFSLMAIRLRLFSQVRWSFQNMQNGRPGDVFSLPSLDLVNDDAYLNPWMIRHVDLGGNFFGAVRGGKVWPLRPDWVQVIGDRPLGDYDTQILGYAYFPGGFAKTSIQDAVLFPKNEVIHWMPEPDPDAKWRGMSWLTPVLREVQADSRMTKHKDAFLANAATPNMIVKVDKDTTFDNFRKFKESFIDEHVGVHNANKPLFLGGGADATVVGANFQQLDFTSVQGKGETRLANAAGVHPVVVGFSEGMQGSSLNAGNFGQARRSTADSLLFPLWSSAAGALGDVLPYPAGSRFWFDARDIPFLREDAKDDAEIRAQDAVTIRQLVDAGFTPESVKLAVAGGDWSLLKHTGLYSVQLQPPGTMASTNGQVPAGVN